MDNVVNLKSGNSVIPHEVKTELQANGFDANQINKIEDIANAFIVRKFLAVGTYLGNKLGEKISKLFDSDVEIK